MPDNEFESLQSARYPRVADVRRRWKEHETLSGHQDLAQGWRPMGFAGGIGPRDAAGVTDAG